VAAVTRIDVKGQGDELKASFRTHVVRARIEVEVEGDAEDIGRVFREVLAAVKENFPDADIEVGTGKTQDVVSPSAGSNQPVVSEERKAA
jgi:hypothetical protein